jgi:uncharacterized protein (TIGR02147 family)
VHAQNVTSRSLIDVYGYLDYRTLLRDYYAAAKQRGRGFSFRAFSRRAGLSSPNHLKRVMEGERNLSPEMAERFAEACGFEAKDAAFFCELVAFNQARTTQEKQTRYEALASYRGYRRAQKLDAAHAAYHTQWYVPAVRELAGSRGFREDPLWISQRLLPRISQAQAAQAIELLTALGLLVRDPQGRLVQSEAVVSTGSETSGVHIVNYHRSMMERAIQSIDLVPRSDRDISALTLCVDRGGLHRLKTRIQEFRRELVGLEGAGSRGDIVVQVNFQLYPLSQVEPEGDASCD